MALPSCSHFLPSDVKNALLRVAGWVIWLLLPLAGWCQEAQPAPVPQSQNAPLQPVKPATLAPRDTNFTVGLVLSGGGALGMAHIGAIQALEDYNIPIDYITGTSAGAMAGGMYATGMTPEKMKAIFLGEARDWLAPGLLVQEEYYFRRTEPDGSFITIPFSFRGSKQRLPNVLFSDTEINYGFLKYLTDASAIANQHFDSLFVPFRAVAADIFEKEKVVLKTGTLPFAVRASMAVPLFFSPVSNERHKNLFDGGIYDNFPVGPMQQAFNPDFIIGVDVAGPLEDRKTLEEEGNFFRQLLSHAIDKKSFYKMPARNSLYVAPALGDMSSTDFDLASLRFAYQRGYQATASCITDLQRAIPRSVDSLTLARRREAFRSKAPAWVIGRIEIEGVSASEQIFVEKLLGIQPGDTLSHRQLRKGIRRLRAEGDYMNFFPELYWVQDSGFFELRVRLKPASHIKLRLGGAFFTPTDHQLQLGAEYSGNKIVGYRAALSLMQGSFMNHVKVKGRLFIPSKTPFIIELQNRLIQWELQNTILSFFNTDNRANIGFNSLELRPSIGVPLFRNGKLSIGHSFMRLRNQYFRENQPPGEDPDATRWEGQSTFLSYFKNTFNEKMYPEEGSELYFNLRFNQGEETYTSGNDELPDYRRNHTWLQAYFFYHQRLRLSPSWTVGYSFDAAFSNLAPFHNRRATLLSAPKFLPLQDSPMLFVEGLYSKAYAAPGLNIQRKIAEDFYLKADLYWMQSFLESSQETDLNGIPQVTESYSLQLENGMAVASVGGFYRTAIGPIGVFGNYYQQPASPLRLFVHIGYLLFDRHPWN